MKPKHKPSKKSAKQALHHSLKQSKVMEGLFRIHKRPIPDTPCWVCEETKLVRLMSLTWGPYGGQVIYESCGAKKSTYNFLGDSIFKVEPMPLCPYRSPHEGG